MAEALDESDRNNSKFALLSKSGFISCNSCHNLSMGGTDNLKTSIGHNWNKGPINAPAVLNAKLSLAQFWDGRAMTLQDQAGGPIANPGEMGSTHTLAVAVLQSIPVYVAEFKAVFGNDTVTPNSRFDKWLKGDKKALSAQEVAGYELFKDSGCTGCHNGAAVGGNTFQKMGVVEPYKSTSPAQGRVAVTKEEADRFFFKVPTLRNVELTYPYFPDGEAAPCRRPADRTPGGAAGAPWAGRGRGDRPDPKSRAPGRLGAHVHIAE